jgi:hypothetical protein
MSLEDLEMVITKFWEGIFRKGRCPIQPVEIARSLVREMVAQRRVSVSRVYAPNQFIISMGKADFEKNAPLLDALSQELAEYIKNKAAEKEYTLIGRPKIDFTLDETLKLGEIAVQSAFAASEEASEDKIISALSEVPVLESVPIENMDVDHTMVFDAEKLGEETEAKMELVVVSGPDQGKRISLDGEKRYYIGRKSTNHLVLSDINASREHAALEWRDGELYLIDLGSRNGTYINGVRIDQQRLVSGDQFLIGENLFQVEGG